VKTWSFIAGIIASLLINNTKQAEMPNLGRQWKKKPY